MNSYTHTDEGLELESDGTFDSIYLGANTDDQPNNINLRDDDNMGGRIWKGSYIVKYGGQLSAPDSKWTEDFWIDLVYAPTEISGALSIRFQFDSEQRMENQGAAPQ